MDGSSFDLIKSLELFVRLVLISFSKHSDSWKVLQICELCALSTDSQKMYSVNTMVAVATVSTGDK